MQKLNAHKLLANTCHCCNKKTMPINPPENVASSYVWRHMSSCKHFNSRQALISYEHCSALPRTPSRAFISMPVIACWGSENINVCNNNSLYVCVYVCLIHTKTLILFVFEIFYVLLYIRYKQKSPKSLLKLYLKLNI